MTMLQLPRARSLGLLLLALTLALRGTAGAFAEAPANCPMQEHGCCDLARMSCCSNDSSPAAPLAPPVAQATVSAPQLPTDGTLAALPDDTAAAEQRWAVHLVPVHGYRSADLSVLLSVFLI